MQLSREESFHLEEYKALRQELATTLKDRLDFNRWGLIGIAALYSYLITHPKPPVLFAVPFFFSLVVYWHLFEQHKTVVDIAEYIKEIEGWIAAGRPNGPGGPEGWEVNLGPSKDRPPSTWWPLRLWFLICLGTGVIALLFWSDAPMFR